MWCPRKLFCKAFISISLEVKSLAKFFYTTGVGYVAILVPFKKASRKVFVITILSYFSVIYLCLFGALKVKKKKVFLRLMKY